jgi:hypothetical protein
MLEAEIQRLTAAIEALNAKLDSFVIPVQAQKSYQEDDAYRAGLQAGRDASAQRADQQIAQDAAATKPAKAAKAKAAPTPEPAPAPEPAPDAEPAPEPAPSISKDNLKAMALSISRADNTAKPQIFAILGKYGVKTISALPDDPDALYDVFTGFTKIADKIAKDGE